MEWHVLMLALYLSLPSSIQDDCSLQCVKCAQQSQNEVTQINSLVCTLECEGALSSSTELQKCEKVLQMYSARLFAVNDKAKTEKEDQPREPPFSNPVKRYGGFLKKVDKSKYNSSPEQNSNIKSLLAKKYLYLLRKFGERDIPDMLQGTKVRGGALENEDVVFEDATTVNKVKRYEGFLRKFGPKRSLESGKESSEKELQKRYGGFMRRVRPKLKWDNQKRYGGFLRRHFKKSVQSDDEPGL
ncbi:proenkephalin-B-like [Polyodon spathula]|uniref:proenkephalin-B-like n=1 Tax=Polyodon spathula TaxID=7913 RepID=UPI001B7E51A8|nr:proenkephalin-B-like [Polyodon spathula]